MPTRAIDAISTNIRQRHGVIGRRAPTPIAALIGDTWLTTTTSRVARLVERARRTRHATRAPSATSDSPPGGHERGSARHARHTSLRARRRRGSAVELAVVELDPALVDLDRAPERRRRSRRAPRSGLAITRASRGIRAAERGRLPSALVRQRRVGPAEEQAARVRVGTAVANEAEHRRDATRVAAGATTESASSRRYRAAPLSAAPVARTRSSRCVLATGVGLVPRRSTERRRRAPIRCCWSMASTDRAGAGV